MAKLLPLSFYDFMQQYPHKFAGRRALAANLKELAPSRPFLKDINSLVDLMAASNYLTDDRAAHAISGALWCEYCTITGRSVFEEYSSDEQRECREEDL